jgi:hypothetical protein
MDRSNAYALQRLMGQIVVLLQDVAIDMMPLFAIAWFIAAVSRSFRSRDLFEQHHHRVPRRQYSDWLVEDS